MTESSAQKQGAPPFRAVLTPYRSLGAKGFLVLMLALGLVSFVTGFVFLLLGAWPVFAFFGLDVLLVYVAFRLNYRSGRLYELVELTPSALTVTRVHPSGARENFAFNPYWVRVRLAQWPDGRTDLRLSVHDNDFVFGRFLTDDERRSFADALSGALMTTRGAVAF